MRCHIRNNVRILLIACQIIHRNPHIDYILPRLGISHHSGNVIDSGNIHCSWSLSVIFAKQGITVHFHFSIIPTRVLDLQYD
jgi:hypothetical protein